MKVLRIICPKCNKERKEITEEDNLADYQEEIAYERCPHHPAGATDKLLAAIFGEKSGQ